MYKMTISWPSPDGLGVMEASFYKSTEKEVVDKAAQIANEMQTDNPSLCLNFTLFEEDKEPGVWMQITPSKESQTTLSGV